MRIVDVQVQMVAVPALPGSEAAGTGCSSRERDPTVGRCNGGRSQHTSGLLMNDLVWMVTDAVVRSRATDLP